MAWRLISSSTFWTPVTLTGKAVEYISDNVTVLQIEWLVIIQSL